jgi:hypothetical protein
MSQYATSSNVILFIQYKINMVTIKRIFCFAFSSVGTEVWQVKCGVEPDYKCKELEQLKTW